MKSQLELQLNSFSFGISLVFEDLFLLFGPSLHHFSLLSKHFLQTLTVLNEHVLIVLDFDEFILLDVQQLERVFLKQVDGLTVLLSQRGYFLGHYFLGLGYFLL
mgnify:FL=1